MMIEIVAKGVEACLLLGPGRRRWPARLRLQGPVHPLVAAVLLRLAPPRACCAHSLRESDRWPPGHRWRDALEVEAELQPLHRKPGQPAGPGRGERWAVVHQQPLGQAVLMKQP